MFSKLGTLIVRRKKSVFALFITAILVMGGVGSLAFAKLDSGGYSDPKSDSAKAAKYISDTFHIKDPAALLIVRSKNLMSDPVSIADAQTLEASIAAENGVAKTLSYWSAGGAPTLLSKDQKAAYIFVYTKAADAFKAKDLAKFLPLNMMEHTRASVFMRAGLQSLITQLPKRSLKTWQLLNQFRFH